MSLRTSPDELMEQAETFLKRNRPAEHRQLKQAGDLQAYLQKKADATDEYAQLLMRNGVPETTAWYRAISAVILEKETD